MGTVHWDEVFLMFDGIVGEGNNKPELPGLIQEKLHSRNYRGRKAGPRPPIN
jgi:hypothetical protein